MPRTQRFKLRESARSGFVYRETTLVDDEGSLVSAGEFDQPPPSNIPLGGEGESSPGDTNPFYTSYTSSVISRATQIIQTTSRIVSTPEQAELNNQPMRNWIWIVGSLTNITLNSNPQVTAGREGQTLILHCVGSAIAISHSNGLALIGGQPFYMDSGAILCLTYTSGNSATKTQVWLETSRGHENQLLGA